jgi:hypothetical protein
MCSLLQMKRIKYYMHSNFDDPITITVYSDDELSEHLQHAEDDGFEQIDPADEPRQWTFSIN